MIDLEAYKGELIMVLLSRPIPYVVKHGNQFQPMMVPAQKEGEQPLPALTDMLQGRLDKRGESFVMTYVNPANKATRMSVAIDPRLVDAVYSYSEIAIVSPLEMPGNQAP